MYGSAPLLRWSSGALLVSLFWSAAASAVSPERATGQYVRDSWGAQDGLPEGAVLAVHAASDGYLWLGTQCCLVRYDGDRFSRFEAGRAGLLQHSFGRDLLESPAGTIWAALVGGVARYADGRFEFFDETRGLSHPFVYALAADAAGKLWAGTGGGGVWQLDRGRFVPHPAYQVDAQLPSKVNDLAAGARGALWVATDEGLLSLAGSVERFTNEEGLPSSVINVLAFDHAQALWVGTRQGLSRLAPEPARKFENQAELGVADVTAVFEDGRETLWVGTREGLFRRREGRFERAEAVPSGVFALTEDASGALWIGTGDGLLRYRDGAFVTAGKSDGLASEQILNVLPRAAGGLWLLDASGAVSRYEAERVTPVLPAGSVAGDGMLGMAETSDGSLWIGGATLSRFHAGRREAYSPPNGGISVVVPDGDGLLLAQTAGDGQSALSRFREGRFEAMPVTAALAHVQRLYRGPSGALWIATGGKGLVRIAGGRERVFRVGDGLPHDVVYGMVEGPDGSLWLATRAGIARLKGEQVFGFGLVSGTPTRSPVHVSLDALSNLWVTADDGVYRLPLAELNQVADGGASAVVSDVYTTRDGLRSLEISWRCAAQAVLPDGSIYYATQRGLSHVDPMRVPEDHSSPRARIEELWVGGKRYDERRPARLSDGRERIEIRYTTPQLSSQNRLEFRYRLAGYDASWVDARAGRVAHYTNVPAGEYRFQVAVRRPGGAFGSEPASLLLRVLPRWYETALARAAMGVSGVLLAYGLYRLQLLRVRKNEQLLRRRVLESTEELRREVAERRVAEDRARALTDELERRVRERTAQLELANLAARRSEARYALAVQGAQDGLWDWDLASGKLYLSPRWKAQLGYEDHELSSTLDAWLSHVHDDDVVALRHVLEPKDRHAGPIRHEYRMRDKHGRELWMLCRGVLVFDSRGIPVRAAGSQTDITARKVAEAELRRNATHDALSGLPNRLLFTDRLEQAMLRARSGSRPGFAVLYLDLDRFKSVNESFGHAVGDRLLSEVATRLRSCLREIDTAARVGGDEFAVVLPELPSESYPLEVADRLQQALREPFSIGERQVVLAVSVGIRLGGEGHPEHLLRDADTAMYRAKAQGRGRYHVFDELLKNEASDRLRVETGLRRAIAQNELVLHYQPLISLTTGAAVGVEALVRWQDPERGLVGPSEFVGIAEACGLIAPLSEWVLSAACDQAKAWQQRFAEPACISVNVPPLLLNDPTLAAQIGEHLARRGLRASAIGLEIVETSVLETGSNVLDNLHRLRDMGVQVSIDDFGAGYSSFGYLKRLPIQRLKIDRSLTQSIPADTNDTAICRTILAMTAELKLTAVAEGVETQAQADFLRANGCGIAQGYFFSRPLPADECTAFLAKDVLAERRATA